jgi:RimJ/RimL family protein N-acetyltransferase
MSRQTERTQETLVAESTLSLETDRLILRQWCDRDFKGFCEMNADPEVMRYFPKTLTESECLEFMSKMSSLIGEQGWGFWAVEIKASKEVIGFVGLNSPAGVCIKGIGAMVTPLKRGKNRWNTVSHTLI